MSSWRARAKVLIVVLYADFYLKGGVLGAWTSMSLDTAPSSWTAMSSSDFSFPSGVRHARAIRIAQNELDALIARHGVSSRLRTTHSEGEVPFYVAALLGAGIVTTLADRTNRQMPNDFLWRVAPGFANPKDSSLVSFESIRLPGSYLRMDCAKPTRYPSCSEGSNRSYALCWVATADRTSPGADRPFPKHDDVQGGRDLPPSPCAERKHPDDFVAMVPGFHPLPAAHGLPNDRHVCQGRHLEERRIVHYRA